MTTRNSRFGASPDRNDDAVNTVAQSRKRRRRPRRPVSQAVAGTAMALAAR
jgi:hypothetical protein